MILLDVNVLVYAHREDAERHSEYRDWLETQLDSPQGCSVSELALSGCLRILTHPRIFDPLTPQTAALEYVATIRDHRGTTVISPSDRHWEIFLDLCRRANARGNLASDAYHAALAIESGCDWVTTDHDFARFPGLRWFHPIAGED